MTTLTTHVLLGLREPLGKGPSLPKAEAPTAPSQQRVAGLGLGMEPAHPVSASEPPAMSRCQAPKRLVLGRGNRGGTALLGHGEARPLACHPLPKQQPLSAPALREHSSVR